jgi:hypothetical protein
MTDAFSSISPAFSIKVCRSTLQDRSSSQFIIVLSIDAKDHSRDKVSLSHEEVNTDMFVASAKKVMKARLQVPMMAAV